MSKKRIHVTLEAAGTLVFTSTLLFDAGIAGYNEAIDFIEQNYPGLGECCSVHDPDCDGYTVRNGEPEVCEGC